MLGPFPVFLHSVAVDTPTEKKGKVYWAHKLQLTHAVYIGKHATQKEHIGTCLKKLSIPPTKRWPMLQWTLLHLTVHRASRSKGRAPFHDQGGHCTLVKLYSHSQTQVLSSKIVHLYRKNTRVGTCFPNTFWLQNGWGALHWSCMPTLDKRQHRPMRSRTEACPWLQG